MQILTIALLALLAAAPPRRSPRKTAIGPAPLFGYGRRREAKTRGARQPLTRTTAESATARRITTPMYRYDYVDFTECRTLLKEILLDESFPVEELRTIVDEASGVAGRAEFAEFNEPEQYATQLKQLLLTAPPGDWLGDLFMATAWAIGDEVFKWEWDSGGPGAGAGEVSVDRLGRWFVGTSDDLGVAGPFETLQDALALELPHTEEGLLKIGEETVAIQCSQWTTEELILRLDLARSDPRASFNLNGEYWYLEELEHEQAKLRADRDPPSRDTAA